MIASLPKGANFSQLRREMVKTQLQGRDITNQKVLRVMSQVPREKFIPYKLRYQAYQDGALPIGGGQTISQPYIVALMSQLLDLKGGEKVLEVGTGSGYQAAVLAGLAKQVFSIERETKLLSQAKQVFKKLGLRNINSKLGDGSKGWPSKAPFDGIIVTAAGKKIPRTLTDQLAENGRLVMPVGSSFWQRLVRVTKKNHHLNEEDFGGCAFVPLIESK